MALGAPSPRQSRGPSRALPRGRLHLWLVRPRGCRRTPPPARGYVTAVPAGASPRARTYLGLRPAPRRPPRKGETPGFLPPSGGSGREPRWDREQRRRGTGRCEPGYCLLTSGHLSSPSSRRHPVTKDSGPGRGFLLPAAPRPLGARGGSPGSSPPGADHAVGAPGGTEQGRAGQDPRPLRPLPSLSAGIS